MLEQSVTEGLYHMEMTHAGAVREGFVSHVKDLTLEQENCARRKEQQNLSVMKCSAAPIPHPCCTTWRKGEI